VHTTGAQVQFGGHPGASEFQGVLQSLVAIDVEIADIDESRCEPGEIG
jgi:hypothetical protein